jgi:hypothetical protein
MMSICRGSNIRQRGKGTRLGITSLVSTLASVPHGRPGRRKSKQVPSIPGGHTENVLEYRPEDSGL